MTIIWENVIIRWPCFTTFIKCWSWQMRKESFIALEPNPSVYWDWKEKLFRVFNFWIRDKAMSEEDNKWHIFLSFTDINWWLCLKSFYNLYKTKIAYPSTHLSWLFSFSRWTDRLVDSNLFQVIRFHNRNKIHPIEG